MKIKFAITWNSIRSSYWFLPCLMVGGAIILSVITLKIDFALPTNRDGTDWFYSSGGEGARALLATLAASMVTIFGVVFSIVIVALTLASSQFGPRLLRTFLRDRVDQVAIGTFISTFVYCVLILRTVRASGNNPFVPEISVRTAIALGMFSLGVLIYFINHLSASLQASHIIAAVGLDLDTTIDHEFDATLDDEKFDSKAADDLFASATYAIGATSRGYIQAIEHTELLQMAEKHDLLVHVPVRPGDFVVPGDTVAFTSAELGDPNLLSTTVNTALLLGVDRTNEQDVEFPVNQLVQLAIRSLSPAINDPITAMMAIEQLRAGLCRIADHSMKSPVLTDSQGVARLLVTKQTPEHITDAAFSLLRQYGSSNLEVTLSLLNMIEQVSRRTTDPAFHRALFRQALQIDLGSRTGLPAEADRKRVAEHYARLTQLPWPALPKTS
ncbi:hypothetical protein Pan258_07800 [Symmachiella dynata]|uniref:DUF2254 domain-containing protein n=1 Tax=Symmachiella dynata TaxID=2527995 RepID=UPI00118AA327|nr:DUF2254 domain-containing protein [Symmachiella dynata]QDT46760.1 hypothetical protein Pan258_07800 [Symmachiella dynata]